MSGLAFSGDGIYVGQQYARWGDTVYLERRDISATLCTGACSGPVDANGFLYGIRITYTEYNLGSKASDGAFALKGWG